ncbi:coiled-coil domain-containing protein 175 [Thalassophryne amazonica]|uniref:coiled-coil domain-containing protein 175 n=1 Tax=Thalassophryne amazonica TaxID=390379 RepID=UPI0014721847|nr:coiled-coil domain-containing protein 175 [Thalassophryne amazonica]
MVSLSAPDFPALTIVMEKLKELEKEVKEEGNFYAHEAGVHLSEIAAALSELEAARRAAHQDLQEETAGNAELRRRINNMGEQVSQEIMEDVASARASNTEEIEKLQKDLSDISQLQENTSRRQEALMLQSEKLHQESEHARAERENCAASLNDHVDLSDGLKSRLSERRQQLEELKSRITAVEQQKVRVRQSLELERETFTVRKDELCQEVEQTVEKIKHQRRVNRRSKRELDRVKAKGGDAHERLSELSNHMVQLERNVGRLTNSGHQCEKQLEEEIQIHQELTKRTEEKKKELCELQETLRITNKHLKEDIVTVEGKIEEVRMLRNLRKDSLDEVSKRFELQQKQENEVRAQNFGLQQQLEQSELRIQNHTGSIAKHRSDIKEMEKQIQKLLQNAAVNRDVFEKSQDELFSCLDAGKKNISHKEKEKTQLTHRVEETKREQEEYATNISSSIVNTRRRYQELQQEEAVLLQRLPVTADIVALTTYVTEYEEDCKQIENKHYQEIQTCTEEIKHITRSNEEKQKEVEEKEETLKAVEIRFNEEQSTHQRLKTLISKLRSRKEDLEVSIGQLKENTSSLLQSKDDAEAKLEVTRSDYLHLLDKQALELKSLEIRICDVTVKLEQVRVENNRLQLSIGHMMKDITRAKTDKDRYQQEIQQLNNNVKALNTSLEEAWRSDLLLIQHSQNNDGALLASFSTLLNSLKTRRHNLEDAITLANQQMLEFNKRLHDKTTDKDS